MNNHHSSVFASVLLLSAATAAFSDTKIAAKYTSDGQTTETTVYAKGERLRYEYGDGLILVRQCDQKRVIQIDNKAKTYMSLPAEQQDLSTSAKITDTGERKQMFGYPARHLKTVEAKTETDGWYIELKDGAYCGQQDAGSANRGFPLAYSITTDGKSTFSMSVTSLAAAPLDAALFDFPAGYTNAEAKAEKPKKSGMVRIGVVPMHNKSNGQNASAAPYQHLIAELQEAKFDVVPLQDGSSDTVMQKAKDWQCDYVLYNEIAGVESPSSGGKVGHFLHHAPGISHVTGGEAQEARVDYRLVPMNSGASTLASTVTGKNGGQFNWKAAGMLASNAMPMMMAARMMGGGGMLNPSMMNALMGGHGAGAPMAGMDPMMSGMSMFLRGANSAPAPAAGPQQNPTQADAAIAAALDQEAQAIIAQLKPPAK